MRRFFPFLTAYDPPGSSEGSLDPLGCTKLPTSWHVQLVPAVRERMQRIRFLTAMAVGAPRPEDLEDSPAYRDALTVPRLGVADRRGDRSSVREDPSIWVSGTLVTRRALQQHGYVDARSYLKTPRISGSMASDKRLAAHLGILTSTSRRA
ncbi:hypothetical protein HS125_05585 [bacterium]|nr:hypothetical protein [bacterium]